jgi:hypothetical protein
MRYNKSINKGGDARENNQPKAPGLVTQRPEDASCKGRYGHEQATGQHCNKLSTRDTGRKAQKGMINATNRRPTMEIKHLSETYIVWSGEGEQGHKRIVKATEIGIKRILTSERCGGDRWAHAAIYTNNYLLDCCVEARSRAIEY